MNTEIINKRHYTAYEPQEKLRAIKMLKTSSFEFVAHRYHCSIRSIYRWRQIYDGTIESLANGSKRPLTPHPNAHKPDEIKHILDLIKRNPHIGLNELYGKLRLNYAYTRNPVSLFRWLKKHGFYTNVKKRSNYISKPYDTPGHLGEKWQMDVKFVPFECRTSNIRGDRHFYQYTMIDEASRERFIYPYQDLCATNTVDFVKRAIIFFRYKPHIIQTDNGAEFTYTRQTKERQHLLDVFCKKNNITHKLLRPRTPRHNGKVERSHRNDNERFYRWLKFYDYDDLLKQMQAYLKRSNNIPISRLSSRDGNQKWMTPNEKRAELLLLDHNIIE